MLDFHEVQSIPAARNELRRAFDSGFGKTAEVLDVCFAPRLHPHPRFSQI